MEVLFYPASWLELAIHGNFNPDSDFAGVTLAIAFGRERAR
ncbi:hypothetical protein [Fontimonas thermophila]|nr:hypothetical protein [Fontimonas thermophila]